jgi:heme/copper-type cytochrome/quinol oxidase subunit 2
MNKKVLGILLICVSLLSQAQELMSVSEPQMADRLREDGKIYVVISVIGIIFLSLLGFLIYIERKVKRIEEKMK